MSADETSASVRERVASAETAFGVDTRTAVALVGVTALALAVRLFALGSRVFHWDEGRVGYWILRYAETGVWEYHAIIHGPFLYHVDKFLFGLVGPSDFVARLPVAVVTGLLPLSAWLFRERLGRTELVALALFFAFNPIFLYYSRFMRNDALLAALMIFALGFYVRLFDTGKARHLYAGTVALALAFTTKENALIYVLTWVGAGVLLLDHRLVLRTDSRERRAFARRYAASAWAAFRHWSPHLLASVALFLVVIVFFYAPRARGVPGPGLWKAFSDPSMIVPVLEAGTVGAWEEFASTWAGGHQDHAYLPYLEHYVRTLWQGAAPLTLLAGLGFVADRYRDERPRDLVSFAFYGGFVSIFGYPIATDIKAPWATVHAAVPLAIPAAVGLAIFVRWGLDAIDDEDGVSAVLACLVVLLVAGQVAVTAADTSFAHSQDRYLDEAGTEENMLVQFGQAADGLRPTLETVEYGVERNDGTDMLWYGSDFYVADESENDDWAAEGGWYDRLPVPWYTEMYGAEVDSTNDLAGVESTSAPVVVARAEDRSGVEGRLDGYRAFEHELTIYGSETVFFVDEEYVERADGGDRGDAAE